MEDENMIAGLRVFKELGSGTFSTVYAAEDPKDGSKYAIKVFGAKGFFPFSIEHYYNIEVNAYKALKPFASCRKGLICMVDHGKDPRGFFYIITELMSGDLEVFTGQYAEGKPVQIKITNPLSIVFLMYETVRAMSDIHEMGYAHSDVKPANILFKIAEGMELSSDFINNYRNIEVGNIEFKFGDPGFLCRDPMTDYNEGLPTSEEIISYFRIKKCGIEGTPDYMSPGYFHLFLKANNNIALDENELKAGQMISFHQANDIWALGQVYRALLFGSENILPVNLIAEGKYVPPPLDYKSGVPDLDFIINGTINAMLNIDFMSRPSAKALSEEINKYLFQYLTSLEKQEKKAEGLFEPLSTVSTSSLEESVDNGSNNPSAFFSCFSRLVRY
jgi:serine/threonine protein kinase